MHQSRDTDEALVARFEETGERTAIETLVRRHWAAALRTARTVCRNDALAEEALQEAFVSLLTMSRRSGATRFKGCFRAWFLTNVTNKARMALRGEYRACRKSRLNPRELYARTPRFSESHGEGEARVRAQDVFENLARLSSAGRHAVWHYFVNDCSQREVALRLGISQQMVSRSIARGVRQLRTRLCCS